MRFAPDFLLARLLHRDGLVLVIDKPAGIAVHAGPKSGTAGGGDALETYFDALRFGLPRKPELAHRLDRDTSGCLALGRHPKALRKLGRLFSEGRVGKTYWALCRGSPEGEQGRIDLALKKRNEKTGWRMEVAPDGRAAITDWRLVAHADGVSFIEAMPKTGRTPQLRVHLPALGCPILGDPQYGELSAEDRARPMMLHARRLVIPISKTKPPIDVEAAPPEAMAKMLEGLGIRD